MLQNSLQDVVRFIVSIIFVMCIQILPWPQLVKIAAPDWILLTLIYWSLASPDHVGIFSAWTVGLLSDTLMATPLGQHALAYSLVIFTTLSLHKRLRQFPILQQGIFIFFCLALSQIVAFWIQKTPQPSAFYISFWLPIFLGTLCWPVIYTALKFARLSSIGR